MSKCEEIDFPDYEPGELPLALPKEFWAEFDSCGEFMRTSETPSPGGIKAKYVLVDWRA